jgi:hypothetical protein
VSTIRKALFAAVGCLICLLPVSALGQSDARANIRTPRVADNTLGMALMSATISRFTGDVEKGSGVVSAVRASAGIYTITFDRDLSGCVDTASLDNMAVGFVGQEYAFISPQGVNGADIDVRTYDKTGAATDFDFSLIVFCSR